MEHLESLSKNTLTGAEALERIYKATPDDNISNGGLDKSLAIFAYQTLIVAKERIDMHFMIGALSWYKKMCNQDKKDLEQDNKVLDQDAPFTDDAPVTENDVLQLTHNFVIATRQQKVLTFAHISALEYLQKLAGYASDECHAAISIASIRYLGTQDPKSFWKQLSKLPVSGNVLRPRRSELGSIIMKNTIGSPSWPFYALKFWGWHCASLSKVERANHCVSERLLDFAESKSTESSFFKVVLLSQNQLYSDVMRIKSPTYRKDKLVTFIPGQSGGIKAERSLFLRKPRKRELIVIPETYDKPSPDKDTIAAHWGLVELMEALYASEQKLHYLKVQRLIHCACTAMDNNDLPMFQLILKEWKTLTLMRRRSNSFSNEIFSRITLSYAVNIGNRDAVKSALEKGVDPKLMPLVASAASENDSFIVKMLLEHNASPNIIDKYGNTALHYAREYRNKSMIDDLLQHGAKAAFIPERCARRQDYAVMSGRPRSLVGLEEIGSSIVQKDPIFWKSHRQNAKRLVAMRLSDISRNKERQRKLQYKYLKFIQERM